MARRLVWVRQTPANANTVIAAAADTANVMSLRSEALATVAGIPISALSGSFTLKRMLMWWQFAHVSPADATVLPYGAIGARVGSNTEFVEMGLDVAFLATSGPLNDPDQDWFVWNNVWADDVSQGTTDQYCGKGMLDIRSQRRVDDLDDDILIFSQIQNIAADTTTLRLGWAALVDIS